MAAPVIDPVGTSLHGSGSPVTGAVGTTVSSLITVDFGGINTWNTNDVIVVLVAWSNAAGATRTLSSVSVSGGAHGPYTASLRTSFVSASRHAGAALYWIPVPSQEQGTPINITATMSGSCDHIMISAVAYSGCFNTAAPFDSNTGLSNGGAGNWANYTSAIGSYNTSAFSTTQSNDTLLFLQGGAFTAGPTSAAPTGYTNEKSTASSAGTDWCSSSIWDKNVAAPQSGTTVAFSVGTNGGGAGSPIFIAVDALTGDNNAGSSTETGTVTMALGKVTFNVAAGRKETATATLALSGVTFVSAAAVIQESGHANLALTGISIAAGGIDFGSGSGSIHFSTFGA